MTPKLYHTACHESLLNMPCLKDKTLIENLWVCKRFSAIKLLKEFRNNWKIVKKNTAHLPHKLILAVQ